MTHASDITDIGFAPVRKSIDVNAPRDLAFQVFTEEFDSWWPRSHHIGSSPMKRPIIEGKIAGRCYAEVVGACCWRDLRRRRRDGGEAVESEGVGE